MAAVRGTTPLLVVFGLMLLVLALSASFCAGGSHYSSNNKKNLNKILVNDRDTTFGGEKAHNTKAQEGRVTYQPTWESLDARPIPQWYAFFFFFFFFFLSPFWSIHTNEPQVLVLVQVRRCKVWHIHPLGRFLCALLHLWQHRCRVVLVCSPSSPLVWLYAPLSALSHHSYK